MRVTKKTYVKKPPKPDYCKCNKGHQLHLVYMYDYDICGTQYVWDCQICIDEMNIIREEECYACFGTGEDLNDTSRWCDICHGRGAK